MTRASSGLRNEARDVGSLGCTESHKVDAARVRGAICQMEALEALEALGALSEDRSTIGALLHTMSSGSPCPAKQSSQSEKSLANCRT